MESYAEQAPNKAANGQVIDINWRDKIVTVSFPHPSGEDTQFYEFDELEGEFNDGYGCFMLFDVVD